MASEPRWPAPQVHGPSCGKETGSRPTPRPFLPVWQRGAHTQGTVTSQSSDVQSSFWSRDRIPHKPRETKKRQGWVEAGGGGGGGGDQSPEGGARL